MRGQVGLKQVGLASSLPALHWAGEADPAPVNSEGGAEACRHGFPDKACRLAGPSSLHRVRGHCDGCS